MTKPCLGSDHDPACRLCHLERTDPAYAALWSGAPAPTPGRAANVAVVPLPAPEPPCPHEGPVAEHSPCGCEAKHVRHCLHPSADWDVCRRLAGALPPAASCAGCPLRPGTAPPGRG